MDLDTVDQEAKTDYPNPFGLPDAEAASIELLVRVEALHVAKRTLTLALEEARAVVLLPVASQLAALEAQYEEQMKDIDVRAAVATEALKKAVIDAEKSVKGDVLQAVYSKPRETWDGKKLSGYAAAHPEVLAFRTIGKPSVALREVDHA